MGKAIFNSDPQQPIKKKNKSSQKQPVPKKPTAKDEEKAKKEGIKKVREAEKAEVEKTTWRISHEQSRDDHQLNDNLQETDCSLSLHAMNTTPSSTRSPSPVNVYGAQKKPKMITTNTSVASPPSNILIVGEPVLNSRKTSSHAHAKKKAKRTTTGTAENVSSSNSPIDGKVLIPEEIPTQRGAKKKAQTMTYSGTGDRSTPKVRARQHKHFTPMVIIDQHLEPFTLISLV